ncbi:MAG: radical SAM protein [Myxococcota bacterium]|nr:radical SAM protein [Myxococcota bacterium]
MRIVLVHPTGSNFVPGKKDITRAANRMVPIGLLSIAAFLERSSHRVWVCDCLGPKAPVGVKAIVAHILQYKPDMVGFSTTTSAFLDAYDIALAIKAAAPKIKTVFGGVHVSGMGAALMEQFKGMDFAVIGEGEITLNALANEEDPAGIDGLVWRQGTEVIANAPRKNMPRLDDLPLPAYHKLEGFPKGYRLPPFSYIHTPGTAISTSRGCVYQCTYCDRSVFKQGFRANSADYTYAHLKMLRDRFGIRHVNIYDDLFTINRSRIFDLCKQLTDRPLGLMFNCAVRVGHTDDALLEALKSAGCLMVSLGVESGDPALLETLKAGVDLEAVKHTVSRIQAKGLRAKGLFMMGVIGETEASIKQTSDFIVATGFDDMNMSKFTPFPGAPCFEDIHNHGAFNPDWRLMNALNFVFVPKEIESKERLDYLYNQHVKRFYTDTKWRKKFKARLWDHRATLWHMLANLPTFLAAKKHFEP